MLLGATYSHREIEWLKLDPKRSFQRALDFHFDLLRLGVYWDECEPKQGHFNFRKIDKLLTECNKAGQPVVLTVGAKAPRWPEYFLPKWLKAESVHQIEKPLLTFITEVVTALKNHPCIASWQIENEPLDQSGPNHWAIPESFLWREIKKIRRLDSERPIHLNFWGDHAVDREDIIQAREQSDSIGIDLYFRQPADDGQYHGPRFADWRLKWWAWWNLRRKHKQFWITELQAEPWEHDNAVKFSANPPSLNAQFLVQNFSRAKKFNPDVILLWGLEYWLWKEQQGDDSLVKAVQQIQKSRAV